MGVATDATQFCLFAAFFFVFFFGGGVLSSTAARMQLLRAAHCAGMVSADKAASYSLPLFSTCMTTEES